MRLRNSDMFDAYAKLAEETGLIKTAKEDHKKYRDSVSARCGSDDISTIEALYGLKIESPIEYENCIMEYAHPNAVVISDSYDKINGLVENNIERHNIIVNKIMSKAPSGSLILHKDAVRNLKMQLIRIGNDMDNADEEEIRVLADDCLEELNKTAGWWDDAKDWLHGKSGKDTMDTANIGAGALAGATSGALIGAIITSWAGPLSLAGAGAGGLIGGAIGGISSAIFNTAPKVMSIQENAKDLLDQMKDLQKSAPSEDAFFKQVENVMIMLTNSSKKYASHLDLAKSKYIKNEKSSESELKEISDDTKELIADIEMVSKLKETFNEKNKMGLFSAAKSSIPHFGLVADDIEDVEQSFASLDSAIENLKKVMGNITTKAESVSNAVVKKEPEKVPEMFNLDEDHKKLKDFLSSLI